MTARFNIDVAGNLVTLELRDRIDLHQAVAVVADLIADDRLRQGPNALVDTTELDELDLTALDVRHLASIAGQADALWQGGRWAVVAPRDLIYGMARMYQLIRSEAPYEFEVFRTKEDASRWLGL
jgi:hypothetical protein